ncbi:MAG: GlpM family protein [Methanosarcinales archaeon]|nr:GlpM family protein [Methanosarcinales archaeon]
MIELLTRSLVGGSLIVLVFLLAKTKYSVIAGLFVLFPIVTLVGYFFIGQSGDSSKLHEITPFHL